MYERQREVKKEDKVENSWLSVTSKEQNTKHEDECKHRNLLHITFVKGIGHAFTIQKIAKNLHRGSIMQRLGYPSCIDTV